ncbi:condensation domain-containing protein [Kitasatospora camelliae]|uniref:Condensation domain-containing protein n=1 Tax=Kitasatospora camelliae TaxID=3156397 RepID=A0AAU8JWK9_9ACTN
MLTSIRGYPVRPGLLVEWRLHPVVPGEPPEDPRAPSYMQEAHLRAVAFARTAGWGSPSWLAAAFELPGRARLDVLGSALQAWVGRHETLRTGFRFSADGLRRFTFGLQDVRLRATVVGEFTGPGSVNRYLEARFDEVTDPLDSWPPMLFAAVLRDDSTTVFAAFDHSNTDGYSIGLTAHEIPELYLATAEGRPHGLPEAGSHADYSAAEREAAAVVGPDHPAVAVWKEFLEADGGALPGFPLPLGVGPEEVPESTGRLEALATAEDSAAFEAVCKAATGGFLAGLLAAAAVAAQELGGQREFRTTVPVHTRSDSRWASSIGWYVNVMPVAFRPARTDGFAEVVLMAARAMRTATPALSAPGVRAWELVGTVPVLRFMVSFIDGRAVPGSEHWKSRNMSGLGKSPRGDHVFLWFHRTHEGLSVTVIHPHTKFAREQVRRYVDRIRQIVGEVAATGTCAVRPPSAGDGENMANASDG